MLSYQFNIQPKGNTVSAHEVGPNHSRMSLASFSCLTKRSVASSKASSIQYDLLLPLSISSILSFSLRHPVAGYVFSSSSRHFSLSLSVTYFRRQFLCKMWPIYLVFVLLCALLQDPLRYFFTSHTTGPTYLQPSPTHLKLSTWERERGGERRFVCSSLMSHQDYDFVTNCRTKVGPLTVWLVPPVPALFNRQVMYRRTWPHNRTCQTNNKYVFIRDGLQ